MKKMKLAEAYQRWLNDPSEENRNQLGESLFYYIKAIIASRYGKDFFFLEDAIGEAAHRILTSIQDPNTKVDNISTWAYATTCNTCIDMLRTRSAKKEQILFDNVNHKIEPKYIERLSLKTLVSKLSPIQRGIVQLKLEGASNKDIALRLNISKHSVEQRWLRIICRLRTLWVA